MRWKSLYPADVGDKRVKSWFALLPVRINGYCRWLETVTVEYELKMAVYKVYWRGRYQRDEHYYWWSKIRFIDNVYVV